MKRATVQTAAEDAQRARSASVERTEPSRRRCRAKSEESRRGTAQRRDRDSLSPSLSHAL